MEKKAVSMSFNKEKETLMSQLIVLGFLSFFLFLNLTPFNCFECLRKTQQKLILFILFIYLLK